MYDNTVVYDPVSRHCTLASAGHPAPAAVTPDGSVDFIPLVPGPPLGVGGLPFEATDLRLPEGSLLVLYTDGLVETHDRDIDTGMQELVHALAEPTPTLEATCDNLITALLPERPDDDVALLVARTHALGPSHVATWDLPAAPVIVAEARRRAADQLTTWGLQDAVPTTELIVSQLVTNAIRHAEAPIHLRLIRNTALSARSPTPAVLLLTRAAPACWMRAAVACSWSASSPSAGAPVTRRRARPSGRSSPDRSIARGPGACPPGDHTQQVTWWSHAKTTMSTLRGRPAGSAPGLPSMRRRPAAATARQRIRRLRRDHGRSLRRAAVAVGCSCCHRTEADQRERDHGHRCSTN
jgi:hypothetical protein